MTSHLNKPNTGLEIHEALGYTRALHRPAMVADVCNAITHTVEVGSEVQGQPAIKETA